MALDGVFKAEWRVVKKRVRRWGGEDVGWDVSAFRSHCNTDILHTFTFRLTFCYSDIPRRWIALT
jgi:hypothetical protein